jgi:predicted DNA-binding transcriptional regulator AlpA
MIGLAAVPTAANPMAEIQKNTLSFLTDAELADLLRISQACLRRWRLAGIGPRYVKIGASVRYRTDELQLWLSARPTGGDLMAVNHE